MEILQHQFNFMFTFMSVIFIELFQFVLLFYLGIYYLRFLLVSCSHFSLCVTPTIATLPQGQANTHSMGPV